jgi:hypothetical protein
MSANRPSPPPGAGKAARAVVIIIGLMILVIFVGFNMQHASDQKTGHVDPAGVPKSSTDLQAAPSQHK